MTKFQFAVPAFKKQPSLIGNMGADPNFNYMPMNSVSQFLADNPEGQKNLAPQLNSFILPSLGSFGNLWRLKLYYFKHIHII